MHRTALATIFVLAVTLAACEEELTPTGSTNGDGDDATNTPADEAPTATPTSAPPFEPITGSGSGDFATDPFTLPDGVYVADFLHSGSRNFIVLAYPEGDSEDLLINVIGNYQGSRPITGGTYQLDIQADGTWSFAIARIDSQEGPAFAGDGDDVSGTFDGPGRVTIEYSHDGARNFIVWLHCGGSGTDLVENSIGAISAASSIVSAEGACFWEVEADSSWSIAAR